VRWAGWLGPGAVVGAFDVPFDVLAFNDPRVGAWSPDGVESAAQQDDGVAPAVVTGSRGENRAPLRSSGERCVER